MWAGRFDRAPEAGFYEFQRSLPFDKRLLPYEIAVDRAWARALAGAKLLTPEECAQMLAALDKIESRARAEPQWVAQSSAEDVHHFVEAELMALIGAIGAKLHTGRSRNELVATDMRLFIRDACREIRGAVAGLIGALLGAAETYFAVPMAGNTHLQHAQPILFSHFLHSHMEAFFKSADRVAAAAKICEGCPMGSGAIAGSGFAIDREAIARELGFPRLTHNSLAATAHRSFALDFLYALSSLATNLSALAADYSLFATPEFGWIVLPDEYSTGSSLMPQKKNPDAWELIRGKTGRITAALFALFTTLKALPSGYQRDLQEDKEGLFDACDQALAMLRVAAGAVAATAINEKRMREAAEDPALLATELADYLVTKGIPFREAHEITARIVKESEAAGQQWHTLPLPALKRYSAAFQDDVRGWLTVESALERRTVPGGTAPATVKHALADARERLKQLESSL